MKKLCLLLMMSISAIGFSQEKGTWSVSTHFQSEHNFVPMLRNDMLYWNVVEPMWQKRFHYTTGLGINYRFPNNLELSTGVRYSRKREELNGYYYYGPTICYDYISVVPLTRHYIEMPLLARYYFLPGKVKMHVESGWIGSYQLETKNKAVNSEWLMSAQTGVGVNLFLNRWQFGLGANYRLQLELGERNNFYSLNPHAFGIEFKTAFSLNN